MGFFGLGKKDRIIDLSKRLDKKEELTSEVVDLSQTGEASVEASVPETPEEKRKKFVKKISEMMEKVENISTKIYHLEQRVEVLEKKTKVNNFEGE